MNDNLTPKAIVAALDEHIVGQADAKRAVAVALRNRWRRQRLSPELRDEVSPKNILMIGPTGCGKTEISRRLAESLNDPWSGMATHPIVKELQEQAQKGSAQNRFYNLMGVAWSEYLAGHLVEAERTIGEFISQYESSHSFYVADGYFVQAIIKAKLGRISEAREAYRKGLPHASRHFQNRGIPYDGAWWDEGVCIEINRREAAALLNAAGLMADDQFQLREAPLTK